MQNFLMLAPTIAQTHSFGSSAGASQVGFVDTRDVAAVAAQIAAEPAGHIDATYLSLIADGDAAWLSQKVPTILGRPARSFEQFAIDYAAAFTSGG